MTVPAPEPRAREVRDEADEGWREEGDTEGATRRADRDALSANAAPALSATPPPSASPGGGDVNGVNE